jgi:Protein of unknown function, DUF488
MKRTISTIGYEGSTIESFVAALKHASIDVLIDVRDLPLSRKKGFSKNALALRLADADIEYVHLKGLGDPKEGRQAARGGKYDLFRNIFGRHMQTDVALRDLAIAANLVKSRRACLMCFECDHGHCHRSIIADRLTHMTQLAVTPLGRSDRSIPKREPLRLSLLPQIDRLGKVDRPGDAHRLQFSRSALLATNRNNSNEVPNSRAAEALKRRLVQGPQVRQFDCP